MSFALSFGEGAWLSRHKHWENVHILGLVGGVMNDRSVDAKVKNPPDVLTVGLAALKYLSWPVTILGMFASREPGQLSSIIHRMISNVQLYLRPVADAVHYVFHWGLGLFGIDLNFSRDEKDLFFLVCITAASLFHSMKMAVVEQSGSGVPRGERIVTQVLSVVFGLLFLMLFGKLFWLVPLNIYLAASSLPLTWHTSWFADMVTVLVLYLGFPVLYAIGQMTTSGSLLTIDEFAKHGRTMLGIFTVTLFLVGLNYAFLGLGY